MGCTPGFFFTQRQLLLGRAIKQVSALLSCLVAIALRSSRFMDRIEDVFENEGLD